MLRRIATKGSILIATIDVASFAIAITVTATVITVVTFASIAEGGSGCCASDGPTHFVIAQ